MLKSASKSFSFDNKNRLFPGVESITCYHCNSAYDPRCGDPFDPYSLGKINCSMQPPLEHLPYLEPTVCRKNIQRGTVCIFLVTANVQLVRIVRLGRPHQGIISGLCTLLLLKYYISFHSSSFCADNNLLFLSLFFCLHQIVPSLLCGLYNISIRFRSWDLRQSSMLLNVLKFNHSTVHVSSIKDKPKVMYSLNKKEKDLFPSGKEGGGEYSHHPQP